MEDYNSLQSIASWLWSSQLALAVRLISQLNQSNKPQTVLIPITREHQWRLAKISLNERRITIHRPPKKIEFQDLLAVSSYIRSKYKIDSVSWSIKHIVDEQDCACLALFVM